jgi:hypothetical protein
MRYFNETDIQKSSGVGKHECFFLGLLHKTIRLRNIKKVCLNLLNAKKSDKPSDYAVTKVEFEQKFLTILSKNTEKPSI